MFADGEAVRFDDAGAVPWAVDVPGDPVVEESMLAAPMMTQEGAIGVVVCRRWASGSSTTTTSGAEAGRRAGDGCRRERRNQAEQREAAEVSEALLELAAALSLQSSVDGIARMVALALDRLMQSAGISVWLRDGDDLVPAALVGYTPREDAAADAAAAAGRPPSRSAPALLSRRVMVAERRRGAGARRLSGRGAGRHDVRADRRRRALGEPRTDRRSAGTPARAAGAA